MDAIYINSQPPTSGITGGASVLPTFKGCQTELPPLSVNITCSPLTKETFGNIFITGTSYNSFSSSLDIPQEFLYLYSGPQLKGLPSFITIGLALPLAPFIPVLLSRYSFGPASNLPSTSVAAATFVVITAITVLFPARTLPETGSKNKSNSPAACLLPI